MEQERIDAAGLDSDDDMDEMDEEMRDRMMNDEKFGADSDSDGEEDFTQNTDMTYYTMMNADEKIMTLRNRA